MSVLPCSDVLRLVWSFLPLKDMQKVFHVRRCPYLPSTEVYYDHRDDRKPLKKMIRLFGIRMNDLPRSLSHDTNHILGIMEIPGPFPKYFVHDSLNRLIDKFLWDTSKIIFELLVSDERFDKQHDLSPIMYARALKFLFKGYNNTFRDPIGEMMGEAFIVDTFLELFQPNDDHWRVPLFIFLARRHPKAICTRTVGDLSDIFYNSPYVIETIRHTYCMLDHLTSRLADKNKILYLIDGLKLLKKELPHLIRKESFLEPLNAIVCKVDEQYRAATKY